MRRRHVPLLATTALVLAATMTQAQAAGRTERVSVGSAGRQADDASFNPAVAPGGQFVAFTSDAGNLVTPDANRRDVYLRDRKRRTTTRVNVSSAGAQGNGGADFAVVSFRGQHVAFTSVATNLVPGATSGRPQIYLRDLAGGTTTLVSVGTGGAEADGGRTETKAISADGRFVAFASTASNLVPGAGGDGQDLFVRDRAAGVTTVEGRFITGTLSDEPDVQAAMSLDGRFVALASWEPLVPADANGVRDVYLRDRRTGRLTLVSATPGGAPGNALSKSPAVSLDGNVVAFTSSASDLVPGDRNGADDAFVRDVRAGTTTRVSLGPGGAEADGSSDVRAISADGRYVVLYSDAANLVPGDTNGRLDYFVHDRATRTTTRVNVATSGRQATGSECCGNASISAQGHVVVFESDAPNLVRNDTNGARDVFARVGAVGTSR
jgi:Tol biopolymer transport system component